MGLDAWALFVTPWERDYDTTIKDYHKKWSGFDTTKSQLVFEFASWRKHNRLHNWMHQLWEEKGKRLASDEESSVSDTKRQQIVNSHNASGAKLFVLDVNDTIKDIEKDVMSGELSKNREKEIVDYLEDEADYVYSAKDTDHRETLEGKSFQHFWNINWNKEWSSERFQKPYVRFFEDIPFNQIPLELTTDDLLNLRKSIENKTLPLSSGGMFFGGDSYHDGYSNNTVDNDSDYTSNQGYDLHFVDNSLKAIENGLKVIYDSWW